MNQSLTFDDVLIAPQFSYINSRKNVSLNTILGMSLPIISSNMDTVTTDKMSQAMYISGGLGCLHRFCSIDTNVNMFLKSPKNTIVSFGLGDVERQRVKALINVGAKHFCLDVAHGAQIQVVEQLNWFTTSFPGHYIIVGNFASVNSFQEFLGFCHKPPNAVKLGIGNGSICSTRLQTGCGAGQLSVLTDFNTICRTRQIHMICDGGANNTGDVAKALAAGAHAVMTGRLLSGATETPGEILQQGTEQFKVYRGSASQESYVDQNKVAEWRTAEGVSMIVPYRGPVKYILQNIEGGLRSAFTYVGAKTLTEFQERAKFIQISPSVVNEGKIRKE